jgi:hypothetical protein
LTFALLQVPYAPARGPDGARRHARLDDQLQHAHQLGYSCTACNTTNDNFCGLQSSITLPVHSQDTDIFIMVSGANAASVGSFVLSSWCGVRKLTAVWVVFVVASLFRNSHVFRCASGGNQLHGHGADVRLCDERHNGS